MPDRTRTPDLTRIPRLKSLDDIADALETTGRYRCLRKVEALGDVVEEAPKDCRIGIVVDCEATSRDPELASPIEIAMIKFAYRTDVYVHPLGAFVGREQPPAPLDPVVSALTGLTDADLAGQRIDVDAFLAFVADADIVIAHNARYDRVVLERWLPALPLKPWGCSLQDIDWFDEGIRDRRLGDILAAHGLYNDGHRAGADCESLIEILRRPLPMSGASGLAALLASARRTTAIVFAEGAPFVERATLKTRGYRWSAGERPGEPRCWWLELDAIEVSAEIAFLRSEIYRDPFAMPTTTLVSARDRFRSLAMLAAVRCPAPPDDTDEGAS